MYHATLKPSVKGAKETDDISTATCKMTYTNTTGRTVHIKDRFGARMSIGCTCLPGEVDGNFHVRVDWGFVRNMPIDFDADNVTRISSSGNGVVTRASTYYSIDVNLFMGEEIAYCESLGLLMSVQRSLTRADVLPSISEESFDLYTILDPSAIATREELRVNIIIIDNINPGSPYYLNIEGRVYKLLSITSEGNGLPDGVHIISGKDPVDGAKETYYTLQSCIYDGAGKYTSPLTLFTSPHDAIANGDRTSILEAKAREREEKLKEREAEIAQLKIDLLRMKEEAAMRKEEMDKRSESRKDYYEERSYSRKDNSEKLSLPAKIIAGVVGLATAIFGIAKFFL